jgi:DNA-binding winged helix-turn-helix (wHTH) protein
VGLFYLIEPCRRAVSKQELREQVWEGLASSDATLESYRNAGRDTL